jgi:integrase
VPTTQRSPRGWGAVRRLPSGCWRAKWPNYDTRLLTPAPETYPTKAAADRWLSHKRADLELLLRTLAYTGLRIGEALALQRSDIDAVSRTIRVRRSVDGTTVVGPTKTHASRTVTMPTSLAAALASPPERKPGELVFRSRRGGLRRYRTFRRDSWDPAARAAGLIVTPHDRRATCASLLIDAGASIKDVQTKLGHRDPITTLALYARVRPGRADVLADKMDALIAEVSQTSCLWASPWPRIQAGRGDRGLARRWPAHAVRMPVVNGRRVSVGSSTRCHPCRSGRQAVSPRSGRHG